MKESRRKDIYKEQHICTKPQKMAFLKTVKEANCPRKTDKPGKDKKNPKVQLSMSLMEVLRWNGVLTQTGAFKGHTHRFKPAEYNFTVVLLCG